MSRRELKEEEFRFIQLLSQRWSGEDSLIKDYSCNEYSDKISLIDFFLTVIPKEKDVLIKLLKDIRSLFIIRGQALWINEKADVLTQLGIKVGRTFKQINIKEGE